MKKGRKIYIGTSGWHYDHWKGPFYPDRLANNAFLQYYAGSFPTVEINNTFYHMPQGKTFLDWRSTVPEDFIFAVKGSRYITHMKKLKDTGKALNSFFQKIDMMGDKLGPVLFQLPPRWHVNTERLRLFLGSLPRKNRYVFEFRDTSWFDQEVLDLLTEHEAAFCIYDLGGRQSPMIVTADFVYIRLHGPDGPYRGKYSAKQLALWADAISGWVAQGRNVYCYFDNDESGYAATNALKLLELTRES